MHHGSHIGHTRIDTFSKINISRHLFWDKIQQLEPPINTDPRAIMVVRAKKNFISELLDGMLFTALLLCVGIFFIEAQIPLGIAGGIPYIVAVLIGIRSRVENAPLIVAGFACLLICGGYIFSPPTTESEVWKAVVNRMLSIFAVITVAWVSNNWAKSKEKLELTVAELNQRLSSAAIIQQRLYPDMNATFAGLDIYGVVKPATKLCGDYYDVIESNDGSVTIVVADVSGHGPGPALVMAETRAILRSLITFANSDLGTIMSEINDALFRDTPPEMFVTMILIRFDNTRSNLSYATAGQPGHFVRADGKMISLKSSTLPLGLFSHHDFQVDVEEIPVGPGDAVFLYSDGLTEARSISPENEMFGIGRTLNIIQDNSHKKAKEQVDKVCQVIETYSGSEPNEDDITIVVAKLDPVYSTNPIEEMVV